MFLITDCSRGCLTRTETVDLKDLGDIILNITGNEHIAKQAMLDAGSMMFGDTSILNPYYIIDCVPDIQKGEKR